MTQFMAKGKKIQKINQKFDLNFANMVNKQGLDIYKIKNLHKKLKNVV